MSDKIDKILLSEEIQPKNKNPLLFQHPYRAISAGSSGGGKTYWLLKNIVLNKDSPFDLVLWIAPPYSLKQEKLQSAKKELEGKMFLIPDTNYEKVEEIIKAKDKGQQILIVLDDLVNKKDKNFLTWLDNLYVAGRHKNISTISIVQQLFNGKNRQNRLQSSYFILHNFPDKSEVKRLFQQIEPDNVNKLMDIYNEVIKSNNGKGCLIVDTNNNHFEGGDLLKYRANELDNSLDLSEN